MTFKLIPRNNRFTRSNDDVRIGFFTHSQKSKTLGTSAIYVSPTIAKIWLANGENRARVYAGEGEHAGWIAIEGFVANEHTAGEGVRITRPGRNSASVVSGQLKPVSDQKSIPMQAPPDYRVEANHLYIRLPQAFLESAAPAPAAAPTLTKSMGAPANTAPTSTAARLGLR